MTQFEPLVVTLMATDGVSPDRLQGARAALAGMGGRIARENPFDAPFAVDLLVEGLDRAQARNMLEQALPDMDVVVQPAQAPRRKKLLLADMDSTMIQQECIDELADFAGLKAEISAITERAMQGELDFPAALRERVRALTGLEASAISRCLRERIELTPGARTLIATMKAHGARTVLVSGGFTAFTGAIASRLGFDRHVANELHVAEGRLAGTVGVPIVDSGTKLETLHAERQQLGLAAGDTLAIGDGANDIPMLVEAGLGIAFHAKPKAAQAADAAVRIGDLTTILWAQGIARADWHAD